MRLVPNFLNWPINIGLSLHLHILFLVRFVKALARLCDCAVSPDSSLLVYEGLDGGGSGIHYSLKIWPIIHLIKILGIH